jgi:hypothetical protein
MLDTPEPRPDAGQNEVQATPPAPAVQAAALEIHPFATLFPEMGEREFQAFVADVKAQGQLEPIWTHQGQVIDGRHRLRACAQLGIEPKTREWDGATGGSLLEFVIALNLRRRHLKERQRAMLAARLKPVFEDDARTRERAGVKADPTANLRQGSCSRHAGNLLNVSERSVDHASKVLEKGTPALISAVDACKLAVSTAADLAELPAEEQARLLALKHREIRAALAPIRAARTPLKPVPPNADDELIKTFRGGGATLRKEGKLLVLEFSDCRNYLDELCMAVQNEHHFTRMVERGVVLIKKKKEVA